MLTRDSWLWWAGIIGSVVIGLATLDSSTLTDYGIPGGWVRFIRLAAFVVGIVSGKMATSPLPSQTEKQRMDAAKKPDAPDA
jgi:NhaP-type Na+/H+ or K+/H+ antiporter